MYRNAMSCTAPVDAQAEKDAPYLSGEEGAWRRWSVPMVIVTHAVIDDQLGRPIAERGGPFTNVAIAPGVVFRAQVWAPKDSAMDRNKLPGSARLGTSRKDDYGLVELSTVDPPQSDTPPGGLRAREPITVLALSDIVLTDDRFAFAPTLEAWAQELSRALKTEVTPWKATGAGGRVGAESEVCAGGKALGTANGTPAETDGDQPARAGGDQAPNTGTSAPTEIDSAGPTKASGDQASETGDVSAQERMASREGPWLKQVRYEGWQRSWGLPRPSIVAIAAGSVARFTVSTDVTDEAVAQAVAEGLGERRAEGFGRIAVNPSCLAKDSLKAPRGGEEDELVAGPQDSDRDESAKATPDEAGEFAGEVRDGIVGKARENSTDPATRLLVEAAWIARIQAAAERAAQDKKRREAHLPPSVNSTQLGALRSLALGLSVVEEEPECAGGPGCAGDPKRSGGAQRTVRGADRARSWLNSLEPTAQGWSKETLKNLGALFRYAAAQCWRRDHPIWDVLFPVPGPATHGPDPADPKPDPAAAPALVPDLADPKPEAGDPKPDPARHGEWSGRQHLPADCESLTVRAVGEFIVRAVYEAAVPERTSEAAVEPAKEETP
jgi:hypothetical protein